VAYNERLIKGKYNDELDRQEFSQGAPPAKFIVREAIEHNQAIEGKARLARFVRNMPNRRRVDKSILPDADKIDGVKINRCMMHVVSISHT
jgi:hypothetical protein